MLHCTKTTHLQTAVQLRWIWVAISSLVVYSTDWWYSSSTFDHWDFLLINRNNIIIDKLLPLTKQENHYLMQFRLKLLLKIPGYFIINIMSLRCTLMLVPIIYIWCITLFFILTVNIVVNDIAQFIHDVNWLTWH